MAYAKRSGTSIEYQGESFTKSLVKDNGDIWEANEISEYKLIDTAGKTVFSEALIKSADNISLTLLIGRTKTPLLFGIYRLLVYLNDTSITEMNYVIAEYKLDYRKISARND